MVNGSIEQTNFQANVSRVLNEVRDILYRKNKKYGNSAFDPQRIFSAASPLEQINVRIDDKLSRMKSGAADDEDTELDLLGYLVLRRIARGRENGNADQ